MSFLGCLLHVTRMRINTSYKDKIKRYCKSSPLVAYTAATFFRGYLFFPIASIRRQKRIYIATPRNNAWMKQACEKLNPSRLSSWVRATSKYLKNFLMHTCPRYIYQERFAGALGGVAEIATTARPIVIDRPHRRFRSMHIGTCRTQLKSPPNSRYCDIATRGIPINPINNDREKWKSYEREITN